ncbi:MAG: transposase zinc-binding domain-containing protein [Ectothiorhodospiraceae bacterium]|nr:transposase zinc-binding domain-containing protein [Ectothiorhodospiraceae bacterium]
MDMIAIIDKYRASFNQHYGARATQQINKAIGAVVDCHTERYGKMLLHCSPCNNQQSYFYACGHRSCHRCQHHDTVKWLERQKQKRLPVDYFMVTFSATAPAWLYHLHPCSRHYHINFDRWFGITKSHSIRYCLTVRYPR